MLRAFSARHPRRTAHRLGGAAPRLIQGRWFLRFCAGGRKPNALWPCERKCGWGGSWGPDDVLSLRQSAAGATAAVVVDIFTFPLTVCFTRPCSRPSPPPQPLLRGVRRADRICLRLWMEANIRYGRGRLDTGVHLPLGLFEEDLPKGRLACTLQAPP